jgi:hypothetical protein
MPLADGISGGYVRYEMTSDFTDAQGKAVQVEPFWSRKLNNYSPRSYHIQLNIARV